MSLTKNGNKCAKENVLKERSKIDPERTKTIIDPCCVFDEAALTDPVLAIKLDPTTNDTVNIHPKKDDCKNPFVSNLVTVQGAADSFILQEEVIEAVGDCLSVIDVGSGELRLCALQRIKSGGIIRQGDE